LYAHRPLAALILAERKETSVLDKIYRIFRILSQFPEETEKTQSAFSGIKKKKLSGLLASKHSSCAAVTPL
jgi:hypothetical protein